MDFRRAPLQLLCALALIAACGDDSTVVTGATEGDGETSTSTTGATSETTGSGLCVDDAQCEDDNPCTANRCAGNGECLVEAVVSNACRPQIIVDYPPRGSTLKGTPGTPVVTVSGQVLGPAGGITELTLNGAPLEIDGEGKFTHDVLATPGGNILDFNAVDVLGSTRRRVQSFLWSTEYRQPEVPGEQMVPEGLAFYLSQAALDDGDNSAPADDIASVLGIALANFDIAALLDPKTPITSTAGYDVYLTKMTFGSTKVGLQGTDGGLFLSAALKDVVGDLKFDCTTPACILLGGDGTGGLKIDTIEVQADTMIWVDAQGQVVVTVLSSETTLKADDVDIWSNNAWTNFLLGIIKPFIMNGIVNDIVTQLDTTIETQLGPALATALNTLEVNALFELPELGGGGTKIPVNLVTEFADTIFNDGVAPPDPSPPQGGKIVQKGGGYFTMDVTPHKNEGVPSRVGCGSSDEVLTLPMAAEVEIGLADDMINQVLYGAWRGGLLEFEVPPELAESASVKVNNFLASGMLAPTASDCKDPKLLLATIGDLRFDASLVVLDKPMTFTAFTSMVVRLEIAAEGKSISIGIPEVVDIRTELNANEDNMIEAESLIASQLEKGLIDTVIMALG
ncbi:MAG: hypothetical protein KC420_06110, partial [Myxococcales bacterium]|nr:hypothetical protein [Myxococcales bacterium]